MPHPQKALRDCGGGWGRGDLSRLWKNAPPEERAKILRERCRHDLTLFASYYFPDLCRLPWSMLHQYVFKRRAAKTEALPPKRRGAIDVILAPRGAAKSTLISLVLPIHSLLYRTDHYILLISSTHRQALIRLENIRRALGRDGPLKNDFAPELGGSRRGSQSSIIVNDVRIDAFSARSELRGLTFGAWRPTWIVLDDVESSARVLTSAYRDALADWMREVIENLGNGYTNIDLIATLLHRDALPARLMQRPDVRSRVFRSIVSEAREEQAWEEWNARYFDLANPNRLADARRFFDENEARMSVGARVLWPQKESYYDLQVMRATRGRPAFDKEKQNAPMADDEAVFAVEKLRKFALADRKIVLAPSRSAETPAESPQIDLNELRIFGFLDPAMGETKARSGEAGGDFAAIATVGIDRLGYLYVLDVWLARAAPSDQIQKIFDLHEKWNYTEFGIETNAFQKFLLDPLGRERDRRRAHGKPWVMPVKEVRHRANKRLRILRLEPLIRSDWLRFAENLSAEFMNQLTDFPRGRHDDGPDALQGAVTLARASSIEAPLAAGRKIKSGRNLRSY